MSARTWRKSVTLRASDLGPLPNISLSFLVRSLLRSFTHGECQQKRLKKSGTYTLSAQGTCRWEDRMVKKWISLSWRAFSFQNVLRQSVTSADDVRCVESLFLKKFCPSRLSWWLPLWSGFHRFHKHKVKNVPYSEDNFSFFADALGYSFAVDTIDMAALLVIDSNR